MRVDEPASAREEAERLVATALAALSAGRSFFGGQFATGDPECCVCPICRAIASMRDPSPDFAERLATGAGDFAAGVASLLRSLAEPPPSPSSAPPGAAPPGAASPPGAAARPGGAEPSGAAEPSGSRDPDDDVWRAATRAGDDSSGR